MVVRPPPSIVALLQVSLDKARTKSEAVVGQEDVPMRSKLKEVEKIYARARAAAGQGGKVILHAAVSQPCHACSVMQWCQSSALVSADTVADPYASATHAVGQEEEGGHGAAAGAEEQGPPPGPPHDVRQAADRHEGARLDSTLRLWQHSVKPVDRAERPLLLLPDLQAKKATAKKAKKKGGGRGKSGGGGKGKGGGGKR